MNSSKFYVKGLMLMFVITFSGIAQANNFPGKATLHKPLIKRSIVVARVNPQMKLRLMGIKNLNNNTDARAHGISIGDRAMAKFEVTNLGSTSGKVRIGYMIVGRPETSTNILTVAPGQTIPMLLTIRVNPRTRDKNINRNAWKPIFSLLTSGNTPYRDSNMADNHATSYVPLVAQKDLAIVSIEGVKLSETWRSNGIAQGVMHPVKLEFLVKVKNNGSQTSHKTEMSITVFGKHSANTPALHDSNKVMNSVGICSHWPSCTLKQQFSIAAIPAGETGTFRVQFNNIPFKIISSKKHRGRVAVGPYICARPGNHVASGGASFIAHLRQEDVDESPTFRANNYLELRGDFGSGDTCSMVRTSLHRRTGRAFH